MHQRQKKNSKWKEFLDSQIVVSAFFLKKTWHQIWFNFSKEKLSAFCAKFVPRLCALKIRIDSNNCGGSCLTGMGIGREGPSLSISSAVTFWFVIICNPRGLYLCNYYMYFVIFLVMMSTNWTVHSQK